MLGPHTHKPVPTARGWRTPTARPMGGQSVERQRLTSDAPHNGGRHPPRGRPSSTPSASNAGPQRRTLWDRRWVPTPAPTAPGTHGSRNPGCSLQRTGGRGRDRARHQTPLTTVAGPPSLGTPLHQPRGTQPTQGMQAKGTVLGPHSHTPAPTARGWRTGTAPPVGGQSGEGQRLTSDAPHNGGRHPPRGRPSATPTASNAGPQGRTLWGRCWVLTRAPTAPGTHGSQEAWLPAREDARPGEGQPLTPDAPHNVGKPPPPGTAAPQPPRHAAPTGHASQGDSVRPAHPHTRSHSTWVADPNSPPSGQAVGERTAPDLRRPLQWWKAPPPGTPFRHPHSDQRRPTRAHAVGPVLGPHARTDRIRDTRVAEPWLPAPEDRRPGEGQRLTPDAPHNGGRQPPGDALPPFTQRATPSRKGARCGARAGSPRPHQPHPGHTGRRTLAARPRRRAAGRGTAPDTRLPSQRWQATPPGDGPPPPPRHAAPTGHAGEGDSVGPPHPHTRTHSTWVADPNSPPSGRAVRGGGAPDHRRPSKRWKAPLQERPSATPTASNAGQQGRTPWGQRWVPRPHRLLPGHTCRGTLAARPRGLAAWGGTAPDTRRPSEW